MSPTPAGADSDVVPVDRDAGVDLAGTIARAFLDNELWAWMIPSAERRLRTLDRYYRSLIRRVFIPRGGAWMSGDRRAAALWAPPGRWELSTPEQLSEVVALMPLAGPAALMRGSRIEAIFGRRHPTEPHWYLNVLAVDPPLQRKGYGSRLIAPGLARADADGVGAYLETQREANVPFYARFGFELVERVQIPDGPPAWLMWRRPSSGAGA